MLRGDRYEGFTVYLCGLGLLRNILYDHVRVYDVRISEVRGHGSVTYVSVAVSLCIKNQKGYAYSLPKRANKLETAAVQGSLAC